MNDLIVKWIFESKEYNGHHQLELNINLQLEDALLICVGVEDHYRQTEDKEVQAEARYHADGSGSIFLSYFWDEGEHPQNKRDLQKDKYGLDW